VTTHAFDEGPAPPAQLVHQACAAGGVLIRSQQPAARIAGGDECAARYAALLVQGCQGRAGLSYAKNEGRARLHAIVGFQVGAQRVGGNAGTLIYIHNFHTSYMDLRLRHAYTGDIIHNWRRS
jgi:hypothetical protein